MKLVTSGRNKNAEAWEEYRTAFEEFSQVARKVQLLTKQHCPDPAAIDAALLELEKVRVAYNHRRDALARTLVVSAELDSPPREPATDQATRVKQIAELLWEFSGRPDGTADDDWHRAVEIMRRASAA